MNDIRHKLLSVGLSALVLLGACAPLTAMAAQTAPQIPAAAAPGAGAACQTSIASVPATIRASPRPERRVSRSWNTR